MDAWAGFPWSEPILNERTSDGCPRGHRRRALAPTNGIRMSDGEAPRRTPECSVHPFAFIMERTRVGAVNNYLEECPIIEGCCVVAVSGALPLPT